MHGPNESAAAAGRGLAEGSRAFAALEVAGVSVEFRRDEGSLLVLDDINFTVDQHEIVCVVGPSGAGKTTLLNVLAGLLTPTRGYVAVSGTHVTGPGRDRAVVFQEDAVFPWMTVAGNVE